MTPARTGSGGHAEGAQDEAAEEGAAAAYSTVHENVLIFLKLGPVVLDVTRTVLDVRAYDSDVAPTEIRFIDMIGPEVTQHAPAPCQGLVRFVPVDHHAEAPNGQVLEGRIKLAVQVCLLVMQVAFDRVYGFGGIFECKRIGLPNGKGVLEGNGQSQPVEGSTLGFRACLEDFLVNFHSLSEAGGSVAVTDSLGLGSVGNQHPLHQFRVRKHPFDKRKMLFALLSEFRQAPRSGVEQNDELDQKIIQLVTGHE